MFEAAESMGRNMFVEAVNRLLRAQPGAAARLGKHAGRVLEVDLAPVRVFLAIGEDGQFSTMPSDAPVDAQIELSFPVAMRIMSGDEAAIRDVRITGDSGLASDVAAVAKHLHWDFEEDLSRVMGDVAAHRVGSTTRDLMAWGRTSFRNVTETLAEYVTEEQPMVAKKVHIQAFVTAVDQLRDNAARLEKRLARLEKSLDERTPRKNPSEP